MRRQLSFALLLIVGIISSAWADTPWSSSLPWHLKTQFARNVAITSVASGYIGQWTGKSCKNWVRDTIISASGSHVVIPPNLDAPYDYMWQYDSSGHTSGTNMPIANVLPGYVVQMHLTSGWPHTAIVLGVTSSTITFIESNWDSTPGIDSDAYVRTRSITHAQFYSGVTSYSVYVIK